MAVGNDGVETMFIDAEKVTRAVENILGNAARYTQPGERVTVKLEPTRPGRVHIMISNTGHKISKERLERWFENSTGAMRLEAANRTARSWGWPSRRI